MNLLTRDTTATDVNQYKQTLGAFKKLNNLINISKQEISQNSKSNLRHNIEEMLEHANSHKEDKTISVDEQIRGAEDSLPGASLSFIHDKSHDQESGHFKHDETLKSIRKDSKLKAEKVDRLENQMITGDIETSIMERDFREKLLSQSAINRRNFVQLVIESCEQIIFIPERHVEDQVDSQSFQNKGLIKTNMELLNKIKELDRANCLLQDRNKFLEDEILNFGTEMNEKKCILLREKERLISKENSLKIREQTLINRETKLIENTKFINTAIQSVNQYMKVNTERKRSPDENTDEKSTSHLENKDEDPTYSRFVRNLQEIKDVSNHSHRDYKYKY